MKSKLSFLEELLIFGKLSTILATEIIKESYKHFRDYYFYKKR